MEATIIIIIIFKKYGVTAIVLAAGVTIGAVVSAITTSLKAPGKRLKEIGQKTAWLLPDLIGSIVSFLFKTVGQVVGFPAEHPWLLIVAVVAFLVEQYVKKSR